LAVFDETMRAAEDYDLWLRVLIDHEAALLDGVLVTRRAGHPDQLSAQPAIDRFRILALAKLLADARLMASGDRDRRSDPRKVRASMLAGCGVEAHLAREFL